MWLLVPKSRPNFGAEAASDYGKAVIIVPGRKKNGLVDRRVLSGIEIDRIPARANLSKEFLGRVDAWSRHGLLQGIRRIIGRERKPLLGDGRHSDRKHLFNSSVSVLRKLGPAVVETRELVNSRFSCGSRRSPLDDDPTIRLRHNQCGRQAWNSFPPINKTTDCGFDCGSIRRQIGLFCSGRPNPQQRVDTVFPLRMLLFRIFGCDTFAIVRSESRNDELIIPYRSRIMNCQHFDPIRVWRGPKQSCRTFERSPNALTRSLGKSVRSRGSQYCFRSTPM